MTAVQVTLEKKREQILGSSVRRVEDPKFITGNGRYVDDIRLPMTLHAYFVRSPYAHAKIKKIDFAKALAHPHVRGVLTGRDMVGKVRDLPTVEQDLEKKATRRPVLALEEVNYVGETVAAVFAEDSYTAQDAGELVEVEYEPLEAVEDPEKALLPDSPRVHEYLPDNIGYRTVHESGDIESAFREADEVIKLELINQRVHPLPIEPRGMVANFDSGNGILTMWISTQDPHGTRSNLAYQLSLPETKVRVIAPDVGGAFGAKIVPYSEDIVVPFAAMKFNHPIKWIETRRENLVSMTHGRGQKQYVEAAVKKDGRLIGLRIKIISDGGAYNTADAAENPWVTYKMAPGAYDVAAFKAESLSVLTNKVPLDAYRGAGRPEATYLIERTMNVIARKLKLDPAKVRLLNYVKKDRFPFKTVTGFTYDTGDYEANLKSALSAANYERLRIEQREAREKGRLVGLGLVTWVEVCGWGSAQPAIVNVTSTGQVAVTIGGQPTGQGHGAPFAQIVANELGIDLGRIVVYSGDTSMIPWSLSTAGSRSAALAGSSVLISARKIKKKMSMIAARLLDVDDSAMVFENGKIRPAGDSGRSLDFAQVAKAAYQPEKLPEGMELTLFEYTAFSSKGFVFPFGTHIAMVEVDKETGVVKLLKYFAMDDCGRILNPLIAEGQVHGGVLQGIGQAMLEEIIYDENGQLLTGTLADYAIPSAESLPEIEWYRTETPTHLNPLGVKGIGEAGTIAAPPTVVNAVEDALAPYNATLNRMPLRPDYIRHFIKGA